MWQRERATLILAGTNWINGWSHFQLPFFIHLFLPFSLFLSSLPLSPLFSHLPLSNRRKGQLRLHKINGIKASAPSPEKWSCYSTRSPTLYLPFYGLVLFYHFPDCTCTVVNATRWVALLRFGEDCKDLPLHLVFSNRVTQLYHRLAHTFLVLNKEKRRRNAFLALSTFISRKYYGTFLFISSASSGNCNDTSSYKPAGCIRKPIPPHEEYFIGTIAS